MSDIMEQLVQNYLAFDRKMFLNPQYLIRTPDGWKAEPDFLAIEFKPEMRAWMVEVTRKPDGLLSKFREFESDYVWRIRDQLIEDGVMFPGSVESWKIGFWSFVPDEEKNKTEKLMEDAAIKYRRVTSLLDTVRTSAWDKRFSTSP